MIFKVEAINPPFFSTLVTSLFDLFRVVMYLQRGDNIEEGSIYENKKLHC